MDSCQIKPDSNQGSRFFPWGLQLFESPAGLELLETKGRGAKDEALRQLLGMLVKRVKGRKYDENVVATNP